MPHINLPELKQPVVIGLAANSVQQGAAFIEAWENWAASMWPNEWRRPFLIAYLGGNASQDWGRFLGQQKSIAPHFVLKIGGRSRRGARAQSTNLLHKVFSQGLSKINKDESQFTEALLPLEKILTQFRVSWLTRSGPLQASQGSSHGRKTLAVLGGMGPIASASFLRITVSKIDLSGTSSHSDVFYWSNPAKPRKERFSGLAWNNPFGLWSYLASMHDFVTLVERHCNFWVAPSNTFNGVDIQNIAFLRGFAAIKHKFINMIDVVAYHLTLNHQNTVVGFLGTTKLTRSKQYPKAMAARGDTDLIEACDDELKIIQRAIDTAKSGRAELARIPLVKIVDRFVASGARVIVMGCTEIHLALNGARPHYEGYGVKLVDTAEVLADESIKVLLNSRTSLDPELITNTPSLRRALKILLDSPAYWHDTQRHYSPTRSFTRTLPSCIRELLAIVTSHRIPDHDLHKELLSVVQIRDNTGGGYFFNLFRKNPATKPLYSALRELEQTPPNWEEIDSTFTEIKDDIKAYNDTKHIVDASPHTKATSLLKLI